MPLFMASYTLWASAVVGFAIGGYITHRVQGKFPSLAFATKLLILFVLSTSIGAGVYMVLLGIYAAVYTALVLSAIVGTVIFFLRLAQRSRSNT